MYKNKKRKCVVSTLLRRFSPSLARASTFRRGVLPRWEKGTRATVPSKYNVVSLLRLDKTVTRLHGVATLESRARLTPVLRSDVGANALSRVARVRRSFLSYRVNYPMCSLSLFFFFLLLLTHRDESGD